MHRAFGLGLRGCTRKPVARIEPADESRRHRNNSIRSFESLPVTFYAS